MIVQCGNGDRAIRNSPPATDSLKFWKDRMFCYPRLAPLAQDLIILLVMCLLLRLLVNAPAIQAFVERIFSVCGQLTAGHRNRFKKSLEMRVFLRINLT